MGFLEIMGSAVTSTAELMIQSLSVWQRVLYTNGRLNIFGWIFIIIIVITIIELVTGIAFNASFEEEEEE